MTDLSFISEADWMEANRDSQYDRFIRQYGTDDDTWAWIFHHVPPITWTGTQLQWAYLEMPVGRVTRRAWRFF